jgi:hypothetical protein
MIKIPDKIHEELLNWSRWCWLGEWPHPLPPTHCGSLESQYRTPLNVNFEEKLEDLPPVRIKPNERNARRVQAVYDALDALGQLVMKYEYPCRAERGTRTAAAHKMGMTLSQYEHWLQIAVNRVEDAFAVCA